MNNIIITIGREFGSGGRTIGKQVAEKLGIPYYDREIIDESSKISGFSSSFIEASEECCTGSFLYNISMYASYGAAFAGNPKQILPLSTQVYLAQHEAICRLAEKGSCVIVGRCADYVLKDKANLLRCFIYAPIESKKQRAISEYQIEESKALKLVQQMDKKRGNRYSTYTEQIWGARVNYDLLINSGLLGIDRACNLILEAAKKKCKI